MGPRKTASLHLRQKVQTSNRPETTGNNPQPQPKRINAQTTVTAKPSIPVDFDVEYIKGETNVVADCSVD